MVTPPDDSDTGEAFLRTLAEHERWLSAYVYTLVARLADADDILQGLRPDQTRRLAEFWLPRGASGAPFSVRSPEIAAFLKNDTNGIASFVIVRETSESDPSGLVHAFASKEHPSARPPTLRVR